MKTWKEIDPQEWHETRVEALVGDILYMAAEDYKIACKNIKKLNRQKELHYHDDEVEIEKKWQEVYRKNCAIEEDYQRDLEEWKKVVRQVREHNAINKVKLKEPPKPKRRPMLPFPSKKHLRTPLYYPALRRYQKQKAECISFFLGDEFPRLCSFKGEDVLKALDKIIDEYDPFLDVPALDPKTNQPYSLKKWRKMNGKPNEI